jgi:hypothetical protein
MILVAPHAATRVTLCMCECVAVGNVLYEVRYEATLLDDGGVAIELDDASGPGGRWYPGVRWLDAIGRREAARALEYLSECARRVAARRGL